PRPASSGALLNVGATSFHQGQQRFARPESGRLGALEPVLCFEELDTTQQSPFLTAQTHPTSGLFLQFPALLFSAALQIQKQLLARSLDCVDKAVMCQFIPLRAAAWFAPDKVQFIQCIDRLVWQTFGFRFTAKYDAPSSGWSDQLFFEPRSQCPLGNTGIKRDCLDR